MKQRYLAFGLVLAAGLWMSGCSTTGGPQGEVAVDDRSTTAGGAGAAGASGAEGSGGAQAGTAQMRGGFAGSPLDDPASPLSKRVFYFEFDSAEVSREDYEALAAHAAYLAQNGGLTVEVVGHADERGSREYNLALGERRAKAIERLLLLQAAAQEQMEVISFGEERPVALGHNEEAWRLNRRVELLYSGY